MSLRDEIGNQQTLNWTAGLTVTDSSSGRQLLFSAGSGGYFDTVTAPGTPGTRTELTYDASGHATSLKVFLTGSQTPVRTDTFAYGGPSGDGLVTVTQGGATVTYTYTKSQANDPFGCEIPRVRTVAVGLGGDSSSSDDGLSVQGTWTNWWGPLDTGYNNWGVDSRTTKVTDARGNVFTTLVGFGANPTDNTVSGAIKSFRFSGPSYTGAGAGTNVSVSVFSPDIVAPTSASHTDPLGHVWTAAFDAFGNVTSLTDPLQHSWQASYSGDGKNLLTVSDPTGLTTTWNYGENGAPPSRLTSVEDNGGATRLTVAYNAFGQPSSATVPAAVAASGQNETVSAFYNPVTGDLTRLNDPMGDALTVDAYDALGDPLSVTVYPDTGDPSTSLTPLTTLMNWDAGQQLLMARAPSLLEVQNTWTNGLVTSTRTVSPNGGGTLSKMDFQYDTRGRLYRAADLVGTCAQYRYDRNSNLTRVLDGRSNVTRINYGANNEPTGIVWPGSQTASVTYDAAGRIATSTDERGIQALYVHDEADRLVGVQFPAYPAYNASATFDAAGRPLTVADATGSTTFTYDATLKRLTSATTVVAGMPYTVSYTYYGDGKVATMTSPVGVTSYTYDRNGRPATMTDPFGAVTSWTYDHSGRLVNETTTTGLGAVFSSTNGYGVSGQPGDPSTAPAYLRTITQTINGAPFEQYTLTHSYLGQLLDQTGAGFFADTNVFAYDQRGRVTSDVRQCVVGGQLYAYNGAYSWDLANNLQGGGGGWTHNSNNQVTSAPPLGGLPGATGLSYDAAGNLTGLNGVALTYDPRGNLASCGGVTYTYDALGRLATRTAGGVTTLYLYDGGTLIAEADAGGTILRSYSWGATGLVSDRVAGSSRFYLYDRSGNTRALISAAGAVIGVSAWTAWGSPLAPALTPDTPFGWNGRFGVRRDTATGLLLAGARWYAPCVGRFTSRDPIGFAGGINLYGYCAGDPVNDADPSGCSRRAWRWSRRPSSRSCSTLRRRSRSRSAGSRQAALSAWRRARAPPARGRWLRALPGRSISGGRSVRRSATGWPRSSTANTASGRARGN